jgi:ribosome-binding protein aMBF1 (putative translation factor)
MEHQDWKVKVLNPKKEIKSTKSEATSSKVNKSSISSELRKIEVTDISPINFVPKEISLEIQKVRCEKKMKQEDLAKACCLPASVIKSYENGKAVMKFEEIRKINKVLGTSFVYTKKITKE